MFINVFWIEQAIFNLYILTSTRKAEPLLHTGSYTVISNKMVVKKKRKEKKSSRISFYFLFCFTMSID